MIFANSIKQAKICIFPLEQIIDSENKKSIYMRVIKMAKERNYNTPAMLKARIAAVKKQTMRYQEKLDLLNELQSASDENYRIMNMVREHPHHTGNL